MKILLTNNEYELSKYIFLNYVNKSSKYKSINNKKISQISKSLINILSDYDYLVFQDNIPIELEAFVTASIEFLLDKGITETIKSTLRKKLQIIMEELGVSRIFKYGDYESLIEQSIKNSLKTDQFNGLSTPEINTLKQILFNRLNKVGKFDKNDVCFYYHELTKNNSKIIKKELDFSKTMLEPTRLQPVPNSDNQQYQKNDQIFTAEDFTTLEELGRNSYAGRVTLKAKDNRNSQIVVIKKFQFISSNWDGYKLVQKEIETLSNLNHPNIPKYLGQYKDEQGFCLVQEYINAPSLASFWQLPLEEVTEIASSVLDILVYLQELSPPVFHRDIKPENILYHRETKQVYLVDFGLAKIGTGTTTTSTINGGTLGFSPPEQLLGKRLDTSSDLYSLGLTLICLLGGIFSAEINQFINYKFEVDFSKAIPNTINWRFRDYLSRLISPDQSKRFVNAQSAKKALEDLNKLKSDSFLLKDHKDKDEDESSLFQVLFETNIFGYIFTGMVMLGLSYYVFYPLVNSITILQDNSINLDSLSLLNVKNKLVKLLETMFIILMFIFGFSILKKTVEYGEYDFEGFHVLFSLFLLFLVCRGVIELLFSHI